MGGGGREAETVKREGAAVAGIDKAERSKSDKDTIGDDSDYQVDNRYHGKSDGQRRQQEARRRRTPLKIDKDEKRRDHGFDERPAGDHRVAGPERLAASRAAAARREP